MKVIIIIIQQAVRIYSQNKGMEFDIEKCAMIKMQCEKQLITEGMELQKLRKNQNTQRKGNL